MRLLLDLHAMDDGRGLLRPIFARGKEMASRRKATKERGERDPERDERGEKKDSLCEGGKEIEEGGVLGQHQILC